MMLFPLSTARHNIPNLLQFGTWVPVSTFVPDYKSFIENRKKIWFNSGLRTYFYKKIFGTKKIKTLLKPIFKKLLKK